MLPLVAIRSASYVCLSLGYGVKTGTMEHSLFLSNLAVPFVFQFHFKNGTEHFWNAFGTVKAPVFLAFLFNVPLFQFYRG